MSSSTASANKCLTCDNKVSMKDWSEGDAKREYCELCYQKDQGAVPKLNVQTTTYLGKYCLNMESTDDFDEEKFASLEALGDRVGARKGLMDCLKGLKYDNARTHAVKCYEEDEDEMAVGMCRKFKHPFFNEVFDDRAPLEFYGWFDPEYGEVEDWKGQELLYPLGTFPKAINARLVFLEYRETPTCALGLCEEATWEREMRTDNIARGCAIVDMLFLKALKMRQGLWARGVTADYGRRNQGGDYYSCSWGIMRDDLLFLVKGIMEEAQDNMRRGETDGTYGTEEQLLNRTTLNRMGMWNRCLIAHKDWINLFKGGMNKLNKGEQMAVAREIERLDVISEEAGAQARGELCFDFFLALLYKDLNKKVRVLDKYHTQVERTGCCKTCPKNWGDKILPAVLEVVLPKVMGETMGEDEAFLAGAGIALTYHAKRKEDNTYLTEATLSAEQKRNMVLCLEGDLKCNDFGDKEDYKIEDKHLRLLDKVISPSKSYYEVCDGDFIKACYYDIEYAEEFYFELETENDKWLRKVSKNGGVKTPLRTTNEAVGDVLAKEEKEIVRRALRRIAERERQEEADKLKRRIWDMNVWCKAISVRDAKAKEVERRAEHARQAEEAYRTRVEVKYLVEDSSAWGQMCDTFEEAYSKEDKQRIDKMKLIGGEPVEVLECMWELEESGEDTPTYCGRCYVECYTTGRYMGVGAKYGVECEGVCCPACRIE